MLDWSSFIFAGDPSYLLTVHVEVLPVHLNTYDYDLIVPLSADGSVPELSHVERRIHSSNNLKPHGQTVSG